MIQPDVLTVNTQEAGVTKCMAGGKLDLGTLGEFSLITERFKIGNTFR